VETAEARAADAAAWTAAAWAATPLPFFTASGKWK